MIIYPPSSIALNHHHHANDNYDNLGDDVIFHFEDINEHRPEFEQYCMKLEQKEDEEDESGTSFKSSSIPIINNPNGISPDELDAESQYLYDIERAKRKEYEMFDLISRSKKSKESRLAGPTIPTKFEHKLPYIETPCNKNDTLESFMKLDYISNGFPQNKCTYNSGIIAATGINPLLYVGPLQYSPMLPPLLNLNDANTRINHMKNGIDRILHYTNEAALLCDDIMKEVDTNEGIFELDF